MHAVVSIVGLLGSLVPGTLNLAGKALNVLLRALLDFLSLRSQVAGELRRIPLAVGLGDVVFPVGFDEVLEILAIGGGGVGDVVVGEPSLQLGLVPFVVC